MLATGMDLIAARKRAGVSASAVAGVMGVSKQYVSALEADVDKRISTRTTKRYMDAIAQVVAGGTKVVAIPSGKTYRECYAKAAAALADVYVARVMPGDEPWYAIVATLDAARDRGVSTVIEVGGKVVRKA